MPRRATRYRRRPRARRRPRFFRSTVPFRGRRSRRYTRSTASRRRILSIASIKKRDNMMPFVRTPDGGFVQGPITTTTGFTSLFMPSARDLAKTAAGESTRERQHTFSVGYKERLQVDILGGGVWKWRRVVFTYKGPSLYNADPTWTVPWHDKATDPEGTDMVRLIGQPPSDQAIHIRSVLWDGTEGLDWQSEFTAKVDTSRVTPMYDRIVTFNPRNESGFSRTFRLWHPTRKNLVYGDEEQGGTPHDPGWYTSVNGKPGMGDLYVYDIVYKAVPAVAGNGEMIFSPEGTYYWHER
uniref:Capsid protein n=1 Tax=Genomoviridae sp. TaxID=2202565 RepID=A0A8F5MKU9_9VIRU|nr:MAG: capsid protein [Genomoviridae sp.]